ncbi:mitochondrial phosphate carrier protein 1, mitochondrial-like isoform X2 [Rhododendron vialii]|uniref:mitochondrial phosphate carrier protein 1, mitochondrial-like isoform X2 n=1 Tax=Rhododendron vialii TaxID=182163 RepID=UPI00265EB8A1|nr:mitochondrial phosphate carrier protein 1, mitochondrial-like isoform X2 [Rhododendron vialii]
MGEVKVGVEGKRLFEEFSAGYYGLCTIGGMLSAGTTHLAITPLDVLKVHMQVNPVKYHSISSGFSTLWKEQGPSSLWRGWSGKFFGYGVQGGCKFGLYEYFKKLYSAVKVRVQTQPHFAKGLADGFPKLYASEGLTGFYRGLYPLWGRNLPFSMVMFTTFEHSVDYIYCHVIQRRKEDCSRAQQLGVTCLAGYAAGAVGTILSNPADNIVSSLYNRKADTVLQAVKDIGLVNLFTRSLPIRMTLVGPVVTLQWFFYDTIKVLSGLPTSGGLRRGLEEAI